MSDSRLLALARAHEQDSLGVEIMHYVNGCVEEYFGENLQISRINASSLDNVTSQEFFKKSTAYKYYDYKLTGRINKVDGLFKFNVYAHKRNVYAWLLNLEVDGQDKTKESFSCAMKMWQSVDLNRACTADAISFTLRANIYKMYTHKFNDANKVLRKIFLPHKTKSTLNSKENDDEDDGAEHEHDTDDEGNVEELSTDSDDDEDHKGKWKKKNTDPVQEKSSNSKKILMHSKDTLRIQLETAIYFLRNYAQAHVYFVCEMLRFVCREGRLYSELFADYAADKQSRTSAAKIKRTSSRPIYDIHCFLGAFSLKTPNVIRIQDNQPVPYAALTGENGDNKFKCQWKADTRALHQSHPVCTVPSFTNTSHNLWQNWTARVEKITLPSPVSLQDMPLRFVCVQRINMNMALQIMREESERIRDTTMTGAHANIKGWNLFEQTAVLEQFQGVWYVQDIVDFLFAIQPFLLSTKLAIDRTLQAQITWQEFESFQEHTRIGLLADTARAQAFLVHNFFAKDKKSAQETIDEQCYTELMKLQVCAQKYNRFVKQATKKKQTNKMAESLWEKSFYPNINSKISDIKTDCGFYFVLQGVADEMENALFSLFTPNMVAKKQFMQIRWHEEDSMHHINVNPILKALKLIRRDIDSRVTDRKTFHLCEEDHWEEQTGLFGDFYAHSQLSRSFNAVLMRSLHHTLPYIEKSLAAYVRKQNIPCGALFLRVLRVYNFVAARELWTQIQASEAMKSKFEQAIGIFPLGVQTELVNFLQTLQQDDTMLAIEIEKLLHTMHESDIAGALPDSMQYSQDALLSRVLALLQSQPCRFLCCDVRELKNTVYYRHMLHLQASVKRAPALNIRSIISKNYRSLSDNSFFYCKQLHGLFFKTYADLTNGLQFNEGTDLFNARASQDFIIDFWKTHLGLDVGIENKNTAEMDSILTSFYSMMRDFGNCLFMQENESDELRQEVQVFKSWYLPTFCEHYETNMLMFCMTQAMWMQHFDDDGTLYRTAIDEINLGNNADMKMFACKIRLQDNDLDDFSTDTGLRVQTPCQAVAMLFVLMFEPGSRELQMNLYSGNGVKMIVVDSNDTMQQLFQVDYSDIFSHPREINSFYSVHNNIKNEESCELFRWTLKFDNVSKIWQITTAREARQTMYQSDSLNCVDMAPIVSCKQVMWGLWHENNSAYCDLFYFNRRQDIISSKVPGDSTSRIVSAVGNTQVLISHGKTMRLYRLIWNETTQTKSIQLMQEFNSTISIARSNLKAYALFFSPSECECRNSTITITRTEKVDNIISTRYFILNRQTANWQQTAGLARRGILELSRYIHIQGEKYWCLDRDSGSLSIQFWNKKHREANKFCEMPQVQTDDNWQYTVGQQSKQDNLQVFAVYQQQEDLQVKNGIREYEKFTTWQYQEEAKRFVHWIYTSSDLHRSTNSHIIATSEALDTALRFYSSHKLTLFIQNSLNANFMKKLSHQFMFMSWLAMHNCTHNHYSSNILRANLQPMPIFGHSKKNWIEQLMDEHKDKQDMITAPVDEDLIQHNQLTFMSTNIILHFTSDKWKETLYVARIFLRWYYNAVFDSEDKQAMTHSFRDAVSRAPIAPSYYKLPGKRAGAGASVASIKTRQITLKENEKMLKIRRKSIFGSLHQASARDLHLHVAAQMFAPAVRERATVLHTQENITVVKEEGCERCEHAADTMAWNPGIQHSVFTFDLPRPPPSFKCVYESFLRQDRLIAHDYAHLLMYAQHREIMRRNTKHYWLHTMRAKKRLQKNPFADIEEGMLRLRWNYVLYLRSTVSDFASVYLANSTKRLQSCLQHRPEAVQILKQKSLKIQWYLQKTSHAISQHFSDLLRRSVLESMRRHYMWKRFLIKQMYVYRLKNAINAHKNTRAYFQTQCEVFEAATVLPQSAPAKNSQELELLGTFAKTTAFPGQFLHECERDLKINSKTIFDIANEQQEQIQLLNCIVDLFLHKHTSSSTALEQSSMPTAYTQWLQYVRSMTDASIQFIRKH